jgi:hypothetical protein
VRLLFLCTAEVTENYSKEPPGNASSTPVVNDILLQDLVFTDCTLTSLFDGLPGEGAALM